MTLKINYFILAIISFLQSCESLAFKEHLVGNYYLVASDDEHQLGLGYHTSEDEDTFGEIVPATVFAVGFNENYFILKQHPYIFAKPPKTNITNFYILRNQKSFNFRTREGVYGPLTYDQFTLKRHELGIPDSLSFNIVYKDLE